MTLISAFRCDDGSADGAFVICADAQETLGDYRFFMEKLEPRKSGNYEILIGGSGYADLIEAFQLRLYDVLPSSPARTIGELRDIIQRELIDFVQVEVQAFITKNRMSKMLRLVIAAHARETKECECWITKASRLKPIRTFDLIGIDDPIYRHIAERLYSADISIGKAVRACLYLFSIAKATSTGIDGPTSLAVLRTNGLWEEEKDFIQQCEKHLGELTKATDTLAVSLADIGIAAIEFEAILQEFTATARSIREKQVALVADQIVQNLLHGKHMNAPYSKFPLGSPLGISNVQLQASGEITAQVTVRDQGRFGLQVGYFRGDYFSQEHCASAIRLCGKRRVVGNQVFVEVVQCKLAGHSTHHNGGDSCIEDNWLQTQSATNSEGN